MASGALHRTHRKDGRATALRGTHASGQTQTGIHEAPDFNTTVMLGELCIPAGRFGSSEICRRFWHFSPGFLAIAGACIPHQPPQITVTAAFIVSGILAALAFRSQQKFRRATEQNCRAAIVGYALAVMPLFVLFPTRPEPALAAAGIMAFGDGSATLVGLLAGDRKLPWNSRKSWVGTAAYVLFALPVATWIFWLGSAPHVSAEMALLCVGPAVLGSAMVESLPLPGNDNIYVGLSLATILFATNAAFVG
jgi:dolichol kinase